MKVKSLLLGETLECKFKSPAIIKGEVDFQSSLGISSKNVEDTAKDRINHRLLFFGKEKKGRHGEIPLARTLKLLALYQHSEYILNFKNKQTNKPLSFLLPTKYQNYLILELQEC